MRIVMFSINPLFADTVMGGAPKHLQNIAVYLGELGHEVRVLCTRALPEYRPFQWHPHVEVRPVLPFKQPFPQPYAIPAYDIALILQIVGDHLRDADRFYMHDGEFLFPYAFDDIPTVVSLRDNVYPETLLGGFLFRRDRLILISDYSRDYFVHTAGRFYPGLAERVTVIKNGLDWARFKPVTPDRIYDYLPISRGSGPVVLHPHRPEESKGILQTIAVVDRLVNHYDLTDLVALVPRWHEVQATAELRAFYAHIEQEITTRGLQDHMIFHDWIPQDLMPEYFSLGSVTLSLGHFPESFGNAVYESLGCGTPSIVARISTHRELLPDNLIDKVDYGDVEGAAAVAASIITEERRTSDETMRYLHSHYSVEQQLARYATTILEAELTPPLVYKHPVYDEATRYRLAPWCYAASRGIYHDYRAGYVIDVALAALVERHPDGFTMAEALQAGMTAAQIETRFREGFLVPLM